MKAPTVPAQKSSSAGVLPSMTEREAMERVTTVIGMINAGTLKPSKPPVQPSAGIFVRDRLGRERDGSVRVYQGESSGGDRSLRGVKQIFTPDPAFQSTLDRAAMKGGPIHELEPSPETAARFQGLISGSKKGIPLRRRRLRLFPPCPRHLRLGALPSGRGPCRAECASQGSRGQSQHVAILILAASGNGLLHGTADESFRYAARAYELSPGAPEAYQFLHVIGASELIRGNYEAAIHWSLRALATFNGWLFTYITLATAYGRLDRMDEGPGNGSPGARAEPNLTLKAIEDGVAHEDAFADAVIPGLRMAGLPER